ncbi:hypothetical protein AB0J74_11885 [Asanoa sp. NPDC049573]|uniref:hypothetical protein n=1 Tax=Asanoa sp. NPDC049573 TaxID=3155396 RepID=UPI003445BB17
MTVTAPVCATCGRTNRLHISVRTVENHVSSPLPEYAPAGPRRAGRPAAAGAAGRGGPAARAGFAGRSVERDPVLAGRADAAC